MEINFNKNNDALVPAVIQDAETRQVLMLGYMNKDAYENTIQSKLVTFYSRSKQRLWTKGEESGNYLELVDLKLDCDQDTLLILVKPKGPTCHKGTDTCFGDENSIKYGFISDLEDKIQNRQQFSSPNESYVASLFEKGINTIAQKVGEESVELVIEAKDDNDDLFLNESADLLFHYLILLRQKGFSLQDVVDILKSRSN